jgi:hypothetical protein
MRPRIWLTAFLLAGLSCLLDVDAALAWGPGTHVHLGTQLLAQLGLLPASVAVLLSRHAADYLYGNVAADVVLARRWSRIKQFCHHWTTGFRLLETAPDERGQAFALGYLSHLAADSVAHGKFIPRQLAVARTTISFGHMYWEMRADHALPPAPFRELKALALYDFHMHHDLMAGVLTQTFLPYEMNVRMFERINRLVTRRRWQRSVGVWGRYSRWPLCAELVGRYHQECLDRMASIVSDGRRSPLLHNDPNGTSALLHARVSRREVRRLRRRGLPMDHLVQEAAASYAPKPEPRIAVA